MAPTPAPMQSPTPAPAPYPHPQQQHFPSPAPAPMPMPVPYHRPSSPSSSSSEEDSETESSETEVHNFVGAPSPAPMPMPMPAPAPAPMPMPITQELIVETEPTSDAYPHDESNTDQHNERQQQLCDDDQEVDKEEKLFDDDDDEVHADREEEEQQPHDEQEDLKQPSDEEEEQEEKEPPATTASTDPPFTAPTDRHSEALKAAAELIHTLDTEYSKANAENAASALDAEEARSAARTAAEIVRRYTTRSHPREGSDLLTNFDRRESPVARYQPQSSGRAPMMSVTTNSTFFTPTSAQNAGAAPGDEGRLTISSRSAAAANTSSVGSTAGSERHDHPRYFPKTPPSAADRIAQSNAEDNLALSLELERTKQALEAERIAHDETKNMLTEEKSRNSILQQKLQRVEATMETQRESLGRTGDVLEEELQKAIMRMEAAEEDAQLALDFAKESEENREQLEQLLQQALAENQALGEAVAYQQYLPVSETASGDTPSKSIMKSPMDSVSGEDGTASHGAKRSVRFSDPICFSNSPMRGASIQKSAEKEANQRQVQSPSTPLRPLVSAGRRLLQRSQGSASKSSGHEKSYKLEFTPEKSAERRQRLREQLKWLESDVDIPSPVTEMSPLKQQLNFTGGKNVLELCKATAEILLASGKRLGLDGHWWRERSTSGKTQDGPLDSLARQYCQSVEAKITHQENSIHEMEALCGFLEESVASNGDKDKTESAVTEAGDGNFGSPWT